MIKRLSYMTLFAAASSCMAQTPLSLQQAVEQANRHRAELSAPASRVQAGEDLRRQSQARLNPRLFLQSEDLRVSNFDFSRDAETYAYVSQVIETSGARRARIGLATANARLSSLNLERTRREIGFRVRDAYWQAAAAQFARTLYQHSDSYFQQVVQYHEARFHEGKLAEVDLLRVQLQAQQIHAALSNAELEEQKAQLRLAREMGLADPGPWMLTEKFDDLEAPRMAGGLAEPQTALRMANQEVALRKLARTWNAPRDGPISTCSSATSATWLLTQPSSALQLNLPLFDRNRAGTAAASEEIESAKSSLEATEFQVDSERFDWPAGNTNPGCSR